MSNKTRKSLLRVVRASLGSGVNMESAVKIATHYPGDYGDRARLERRRESECEMFQCNGTVGIGKGKYMVASVSLDMTKVRLPKLECDACNLGSQTVCAKPR